MAVSGANRPMEPAMKPATVIHFLPAKRPIPATLIPAIFSDMARGAKIVIVRPACLNCS